MNLQASIKSTRILQVGVAKNRAPPLSIQHCKMTSQLLSFLCCVAVVSADWLDGNDGVDRYGSDLPGMPVALKNGSAPRECANMCGASPQCKAWAFSKQDCGGSGLPACYLKAIVPKQLKNPCRVGSST